MPFEKRSVYVPVKVACLHVGGYQNTPPLSVPESVQRVVTVSSCAVCSSMERERSGKTRCNSDRLFLKPSLPCLSRSWSKKCSATSSSTTVWFPVPQAASYRRRAFRRLLFAGSPRFLAATPPPLSLAPVSG